MCTAQAFPRTMPPMSPPRARASYQVGRRPLDRVKDGYGVVFGPHLRVEHQQFIASDGRNFGFLGPQGVGDEPGRIREYAFDIPDYGTTRYDAQCIEQARAEVEKKWRETLDTGSELARRHADFPQDMDDSWRYHLIANNCQDYVADVLRRAEAIARTKGVPLIVE